MRFNRDNSSIPPPSDRIHDLHSTPMADYRTYDPVPQSQSIVDNMMYYQGIYYLQFNQSLFKKN